MNHTLESWKRISDVVVLSPSQSESSGREKSNESCYTPISKQLHTVDIKSMQSKKAIPTGRSTTSGSSSSSVGNKRTPLKTTNKKPYTAVKLHGSPRRKTEVNMPDYSTQIFGEIDYKKRRSLVSDPTKNEDNRTSKQETKRALFGNVKSGMRVVPYINEIGNS